MLCSDLMKIRWADRQGTREEIVVLEGYSASGASLFMGVPVKKGTSVTLRDGEKEFNGIVRHCVPAPNGYLTGVNFSNRPAGRQLIV